MSSLSCRSANLKISSSRFLVKHSQVQTNLNSQTVGNDLKRKHAISRHGGSMFVHLLFVSLILASTYLKCSESRSVVTNDDHLTGIPFDSDTTSDDHACICDGTFYQICPKLLGCISIAPRLPLPLNPQKFVKHDAEHPDHVEVLEPVKETWPKFSIEKLYNPSGSEYRQVDQAGFNIAQSTPISGGIDGFDNGRIVRHRKVYVAEKLAEQDPIIHPIEITIPVKIKNDQDLPLPPPKPVFKMHKYTTYETKPEIQMVPITTTVIKPVDATDDQFVDYKKP